MKKGAKAAVGIIAAAVVIGGVGVCVSLNASKENDSGTKKEAAGEKVDSDFSVSYDGIKTARLNAGGSVHDPSVFEVDGTYYIYGSHMATAKSDNLKDWTMISDGYGTDNPVYGNLTARTDAFEYAGALTSAIPTDDGTCHVWAPDVIYNKANKMYYMYFCTSSTWNASNLCYATSKSPEGPFEWKGALIYSGFTSETLKKTDVLDYVSEDFAKENYIKAGDAYNYDECPNAIDPTVLYDADGKLWMVYGSWSGGIFLLELDEKTGKVIHPEADEENDVDAYFGKRLIGGGHTSMEAPYILYDEKSGYYYLYVSYGKLNRDGGYQIRVFRSKAIDGAYEDMNGKAPGIGKGNPVYFGLKLSGNYMLPSLEKAYMATGHNSAFIDKDGKRYIVYHTRFDEDTEYHEPRVHQYFLNEEGWPCMLPYATDGETISESGYDKEKVVGEYYVINQGMKIDAEIAEPFKLVLTEKGNVVGKDITGTWEAKDGSYYMHITCDEKEYSGVFCEMKDEAGTEVMTFTAVGSNESIWGVKYFD